MTSNDHGHPVDVIPPKFIDASNQGVTPIKCLTLICISKEACIFFRTYLLQTFTSHSIAKSAQ